MIKIIVRFRTGGIYAQDAERHTKRRVLYKDYLELLGLPHDGTGRAEIVGVGYDKIFSRRLS